MKASFDNPSESRVVAELSALLSKPSDFSKDQNISMQYWFTVSTAVEREMRKFHGEERADALHKHHMVVLDIVRRWSWAVAVDYDFEQRQLAYMEKSHDYSTIDPTSATAISGRHMLQACQAPQTPVSPTKRPQTEESSTPAAKRQRRCASCFRCGRAGHLPVSCSATTTTAGKLVAAFAPNTKNSQALQTHSGTQYYFAFAARSTCKFGSSCSFEHSCSLCWSSSHRAARCRVKA
ncbi:hypothetical protein Agabi119p4_1153 [Agaricus bisporus var. burnettii]|uniref:CCHC-type domain-containing protein n=1 Tax=Agaricus bisporus var. burnettii TaxID=192524 RepID=A0A8H7KLF2_AGABI|nr:hypothetical protein Agabi119p4_1153 [Agaricus bisporus var. burnettii]